MISFDYWMFVYRHHLEHMYGLFKKCLKHHDLRVNLEYPVFCKLIYVQSSKKLI